MMLAVGLVALLGICQAALAQQFSADFVTTVGDRSLSMKANVDHSNVRIDTANGAILISGVMANVNYMIVPATKQFKAIDRNKLPLLLVYQLKGETSREHVAAETIEGIETRKYKVTVKTPDGKDQEVYQWVVYNSDKDINPIKLAAVDGSFVMEYKNIKVGPQPKELFDVPSDYQDMAAPSAPAPERK